MSENYYYSSLSGQEIEDTLVGAVRFNAMQGLTTSQKAQARQNIGAGEENTQIKIKGFYDTLSDLQQAIPVGNEGDVYAVGTESPYDIYIWDAVNIRWVNNGPISFSDAIIDDNDISTSSAWSSAKVTNELAAQKAEIDSDIDAVTQSVETVDAAVDGVDAALKTYVRPNLLDNWYFVGGGSQGGYGKFPINQRGQTSYNATGYGIDRWKSRNGQTVASLTNDGLSVLSGNGSNWAQLHQYFGNPSNLFGRTVTLSALGTNNEVIRSTGTVPASFPSSSQYIAGSTLTNGVSISLNIDSSSIFARITTSAASLSTKIIAIKLELGDTQTLAHQENGAWVLNEIPDYNSELSKCQRYLRIVNYNPENYTTVFGIGGSTKRINAFFPFANMVSTPTISPDGGSYWTCRKYDGTAVTITSLEPWFASHSMLGVRVNGSGITQNASYTLSSNSATPVIFSCEP